MSKQHDTQPFRYYTAPGRYGGEVSARTMGEALAAIEREWLHYPAAIIVVGPDGQVCHAVVGGLPACFRCGGSNFESIGPVSTKQRCRTQTQGCASCGLTRVVVRTDGHAVAAHVIHEGGHSVKCAHCGTGSEFHLWPIPGTASKDGRFMIHCRQCGTTFMEGRS